MSVECSEVKLDRIQSHLKDNYNQPARDLGNGLDSWVISVIRIP